MLLKVDQGQQNPGWPDKIVAEAFGAHVTTIKRLRKRLVEQGLEVALDRHNRQNYTHKLDGDAEAHLVSIFEFRASTGRQKDPPKNPCRRSEFIPTRRERAGNQSKTSLPNLRFSPKIPDQS